MKKFIANLFSRKDNTSDTGLFASAKSYLKEKQVKEIIYASSVFSDMDYSEITGKVSQIIGVVEAHEDGDQVKHSLQYYYYRYLFHHFFLNNKQAMRQLNFHLADTFHRKNNRKKYYKHLKVGSIKIKPTSNSTRPRPNLS